MGTALSWPQSLVGRTVALRASAIALVKNFDKRVHLVVKVVVGVLVVVVVGVGVVVVVDMYVVVVVVVVVVVFVVVVVVVGVSVDAVGAVVSVAWVDLSFSAVVVVAVGVV